MDVVIKIPPRVLTDSGVIVLGSNKHILFKDFDDKWNKLGIPMKNGRLV